MSGDRGIWDRLSQLVIFLLFLAGLLAVAIWYLPLIRQNERMRKEILRLDAKIQQEEQTAKALRNGIDALKHDSKAVERLAREQLNYAKPGETVIHFETPATNAALRP